MINDLIDIKCGSEWRKWDLHIHTKETNKNDQFKSSTFDEFCKCMFNKAIQNDIAVIGITDYFTIDNYKKVLDYQKNIENRTDISEIDKQKIKKNLLLPNIELRMLPVTDSKQLINIHCIFNPAYVEHLENDFFNKLQHTGASNTYLMNKQGFISLGKELDDTLSDDKAYKKGIENFTITVDALKKVLKGSKKLKENTIVIVSNSSKDGASALQEHYKLFNGDSSSLDSTRQSIYFLADAIFSGNEQDRMFFCGLNEKLKKKDVVKKCGSLKPCIHGSDAHCEDKLFSPDDNKYCWIKAELTFEGLKQVLYEPEQRVFIGEAIPDTKADYNIIDSVELNKNEIWNQKIYFNPNLNTIIGGRATGKSTLLESVANKINLNDKCKDFIKNNLDSVTINWKDNSESTGRAIEYFEQSYMYDISIDSSKLNKLVKNILKNRPEGTELDKFNSFCVENNNDITGEVNRLFALLGKLNLHKQTVKEKGDKEGVEKEVLKLEQQIKASNSENLITPEEQTEYDTKNLEKNELLKQESQIEKDLQNIELLKTKEIINKTIEYDFSSFSELTQPNIKAEFDTIVEKAKAEWQSKLEEIIAKLYTKKNEINNGIIKIQDSECFKKVSKSIEDNVHLQEIQSRLNVEKAKLVEIQEINKEIDSLTTLKNELIQTIIEKNCLYSSKASNVVAKITLSNEGLEIKSEKKLRETNLNEFLKARLHKRSLDQQNYINDFVENYNENIEGTIQDFFKDVLSDKLALKTGNDIQNMATELLSTNWFEINHDLVYQNDNFNEMSQGKKSFVILKLLLEFSDKKCPILIDQPEDSLDNRAIYKELVQYLKKKKLERQIILVTHNANIVVSADAEQVIVANQHGKDSENNNRMKFQYISGGLENTKQKNKNEKIILESQGIREHVCEILEGGKDAFTEREQKYGFK
ncbi:MAG: TrlF family AAA-like ATPase [Treponemataceae bacterium]